MYRAREYLAAKVEPRTAVTSLYMLHDLEIRLSDWLRPHKMWLSSTELAVLGGFQQSWKLERVEALWEATWQSRKNYTEWLARVFFDYLVLGCAAEARHGRFKASRALTCLPNSNSDRTDVHADVIDYEPRSILYATHQLFSTGSWSSSFGGKAWARIAKAGMLYGHVSDVVFIDHVVDLSHNNGLFLDKGVIFTTHFDSYLYLRALDAKRHGSIFDMEYRAAYKFVKEYAGMIWRLGIFKPEGETHAEELPELEHVPWGELTMPCEIVDSRDYDWGDDEHDGGDSDDDSDHDEDEEEEEIVKVVYYDDPR